MTKLLVYRFSAMGDVILLLPVLKGVLEANENLEIYLLTQSSFFPVFQDMNRLNLIEVDLKVKHRGLAGLFHLYRQISREVQPDIIIDLHGVIRTYVLDVFFLISGSPLFIFNKGTFRKWKMVRFKLLKSLPTTIDRYCKAFVKAGFKVTLPAPPVFPKITFSSAFIDSPGKSLWIGIAPFAKHKQKIWGITKVENLIAEINKLYDVKIILFGGGKNELESLNQIAQIFPNCIVSANHFNLTEEIKMMSNLAVMISMDSANMHLASMAGVPTISIWGATHPALGFAPYRQPEDNIVQYVGDKLPCRPCSVYGNKKCIYSDGIRCLEYISVDTVLHKIKRILSGQSN